MIGVEVSTSVLSRLMMRSRSLRRISRLSGTIKTGRGSVFRGPYLSRLKTQRGWRWRHRSQKGSRTLSAALIWTTLSTMMRLTKSPFWLCLRITYRRKTIQMRECTWGNRLSSLRWGMIHREAWAPTPWRAIKVASVRSEKIREYKLKIIQMIKSRSLRGHRLSKIRLLLTGS
jgi:hypothetical protein